MCSWLSMKRAGRRLPPHQCFSAGFDQPAISVGTDPDDPAAFTARAVAWEKRVHGMISAFSRIQRSLTAEPPVCRPGRRRLCPAHPQDQSVDPVHHLHQAAGEEQDDGADQRSEQASRKVRPAQEFITMTMMKARARLRERPVRPVRSWRWPEGTVRCQGGRGDVAQLMAVEAAGDAVRKETRAKT